jgi:hypothetical protein
MATKKLIEKMICDCNKCVLSKTAKLYLPKTVDEHRIKNKDYEPKPKRKHNQNSKDEEEKLKLIAYHINTNTLCGQKIKQSFHQTFPDEEECFDSCKVYGGRDIKYDLGLIWSVLDKEKSCEAKMSDEKKSIDPKKSPWSNAVQGLNGIGNKFSIGRDYAKQFYDNAMDEIIAHYPLTKPKPSYEEWISDVFKCGKPTTDFVCELSEQSNKGSEGSYLFETIRKKYNKTFIASTEQLEIFKNEMFTQANKAFAQKDFWLQINGPMNEPDDFEIRWTGKFQIPEIISVKQKWTNVKKYSDCNIHFQLTCSDGSIFTPILRWGYGQCLTNLRVDLK